METQVWENKERTLENDPQYFGGYLNMARLNVYNINNHLAGLFDRNELPNEDQIKNSFLCNKNQPTLNWNRVFAKTVTYLPILKVFDSESLPPTERGEPTEPGTGKHFDTMADTLKVVFNELQEFRNDYSHFWSTEKGETRKTTVSNELVEFLNINFQRAIEYTKVRFKDVYTAEDFELASKKEMVKGNTITTEGLVFLTSMFLEREYAFQFIGKVKGIKGTQYKSFTAFRETLMAFCVKLPHEKLKSDDFKQSFTLDLINELNRCPGVLYNVITEKERKKFQPQLDEESMRKLLESSGGEWQKGDENYDEYFELLTKRIRHKNRFFHFGLRYIDEFNLLGKYKFQINLGKLIINKYQKQFNDEEVTRTIVEDAKAFGRLSDFEDEAETLKKIDIQNQRVEFDPFSPYYNITNNKIGILSLSKPDYARLRKTNAEKKNLFQPLPEAFLSLAELQKIILLDYLKPGEPEKIINDFILTKNSKLMNIQFIEGIKKQLPAEWIVFQKKTDMKKGRAYKPKELMELQNRKLGLNNILEKANLNDKQIPSKILEYWLNIADVKKQYSVSERIKLMKRDCMQRLKNLEKYKTKGKGKIPKIGEMATFLAKDIVDMVISKEKKQKITSFYYDKMQQCLALYADPEMKETFIHIITNELGLFENGGHPFLNKIDFRKIRYTRDIYEKYLIEKGKKEIVRYNESKGRDEKADISWMQETFYKEVKKEVNGKPKTDVIMPEDKLKIPFTIRQWEEKKPTTLKEWLNNVTRGKDLRDGKKPVNLPTNLFDETITDLLKAELDKKQTIYPENAKLNELIKIWWQSRGDDVQPFYYAEREYHVYEKPVKFTIGSKNKFSDYYQAALDEVFKEKKIKAQNERKPLPQIKQVEKTFQNAIAGNEKQIRQVQEEDRICMLMIEKLLKDTNTARPRLKDIESWLDSTDTISERVPGKLYFDKSGKEITKTITAKRKRKDYGALRKFRFDRRLPELFEYFNENEIELDRLKNELDAYNKAKQMVFDLVFKLEETMIRKSGEEIISFFTGQNGKPTTGNVQHFPYLHWLKSKGLIQQNGYNFLRIVRNCFSHNQFPHKKTMELFINQWESNFALQVAEVYKQKTEQLMAKI